MSARNLFPVQGGRLAARAVPQGLILVGVVHLPSQVRPDPSDVTQPWTCCLAFHPGQAVPQLCVVQDPMPIELDAVWREERDDLFAWASASAWRRYEQQQMDDVVVFDARFVPAIASEHTWVMLAVISPRPEGLVERAHQWVDIDGHGNLLKIDAPFAAEGMALSQLARDHAVWPMRNGELRTLPTKTPARCRQDALLAMVRTLAATGHVTGEGLDLFKRNFPELACELGTTSQLKDAKFAAFSLEMARRGFLRPERAMLETQLLAREQAATQITEQLVRDERLQEMDSLAATLGVGRSETPGMRA